MISLLLHLLHISSFTPETTEYFQMISHIEEYLNVRHLAKALSQVETMMNEQYILTLPLNCTVTDLLR